MSTTDQPADAQAQPGGDPRFTIGLTIDVAKVLAEHGYDDVTRDHRAFVELEMHVFHFLHGRERGYTQCHGGAR